MTNQETLTKAIEKATSNKWAVDLTGEASVLTRSIDRWMWKHGRQVVNPYIVSYLITTNEYKLLLTDHEFCKALFGKGWQNHLQKMVLREDWLKYVEWFLGE